MISHLGEYMSPELTNEARAKLRADTVTHVVEIIDGYIVGVLDLYELFISKIEQASESEGASKILVIKNLDDLKGRLAKVILMILIVKYFEHALNMEFKDAKDLLFFAGGIALLGLALYLSHASEGKSDH